ncbi:MAG TPA: efflux RND transporter periplasmic adaptor subunit [Terracidiphilus sp.]|nr:efflux RND transporter periplasmic adaptor subunit [Terracidiphilus sp.]
MNARNRVFVILALLTIGSLIFYFVTVPSNKEVQLIGTVDANEIVVSSKIPGRIQKLTVVEGQKVKTGDLIAVIESQDLEAALDAARANTAADEARLRQAQETVRQNRGETDSATAATEAQVRAAQASLAQAEAALAHQKADTTRIVALADQGIMSAQAKDEAVTSLQADEAAVKTAQSNLNAAEATLKQAQAHELLTSVSQQTVVQTRGELKNAQALAQEAQVNQSYANVYAPATGVVNEWAARQGEVVGAGTPIVTIMDLSQTWVYAPLPETDADAVGLGDKLRVVMPSGDTVTGTVIAKAAEADFATQRDVNRKKRDIRTVQLKLLIPNPDEKFVPGMTAEVYIPRSRLVHK